MAAAMYARQNPINQPRSPTNARRPNTLESKGDAKGEGGGAADTRCDSDGEGELEGRRSSARSIIDLVGRNAEGLEGNSWIRGEAAPAHDN